MLHPRHISFLLGILAAILAGPAANAQIFSSLFSSNEPESEDKWAWVTLDTGEKLKGEIRVMYEEELEFDSDHFGIIKIDWDDIQEIRTARPQMVRTNERTSHDRKLRSNHQRRALDEP